MDRFHGKLVPFMLSVTNTLAGANTLTYGAMILSITTLSITTFSVTINKM
jgi:hypothetical protein